MCHIWCSSEVRRQSLPLELCVDGHSSAVEHLTADQDFGSTSSAPLFCFFFFFFFFFLPLIGDFSAIFSLGCLFPLLLRYVTTPLVGETQEKQLREQKKKKKAILDTHCAILLCYRHLKRMELIALVWLEAVGHAIQLATATEHNETNGSQECTNGQ